MEEHTVQSKTVTNINKDDNNEELNIACQKNLSVHRPATLNTATRTNDTNAQQNIRRYNIEDIHITPSPMDSQPRLFQAGSIIDQATFARIEASVSNKMNVALNEDEVEDENDDEINSESTYQDLNQILYDTKDEEIEQLSQFIISQQPVDDENAQSMLNELNLALENTAAMAYVNAHDSDGQQVLTARTTTTAAAAAASSSSVNSTQHPYPPIHRTGPVKAYDRPYADYGHLDRHIIAQECGFNLQIPVGQQSIRLSAKSFAITSWTNVSKELVMNVIKEEFGIENIQYICIAEGISEFNHQRHLYIQIIFKEKIDRRKPFLDKITKTHCNYQVTRNDVAWNEYIKKGGNIVEFNEFKSVMTRGEKQWATPSSLPTATTAPSSSSVSTSFNLGQPPVPRATTTTRRTTVRAQAEERRQRTEDITQQAFNLAQTDMDAAMALIQRYMPVKFLDRSSFNLNTFKYIHLIVQRNADRRGHIHKEYVWPISFPDCTPALREAMNLWIEHNFSLTKHAKCLILIGPTRSGKTSFALSLPGRPNYFRGRWNLDLWNDYARYSVYDDIPWDQFEKLNFPIKKHLFCQNGSTNVSTTNSLFLPFLRLFHKKKATDKYRATKQIQVRQPAIILLNREDAGSITAEPLTASDRETAAYWKENAFVYLMGDDEYFYVRDNRDSTIQENNPYNPSKNINDERLGEPDEFEKMHQHFLAKQSKK